MFTITVLDVDEFDVTTPVDGNALANAVNENAANGTLVGVTAVASDGDATTNAVTYSLADDAGGRFAIDPVTGVVSVANGTLLNREIGASHNITVRATSADGSTADNVFTIQINDVDEFDVGPITDTNPAANQVAPNAAIGAAVGITAFAIDADATNNTITYSLDDHAGGRFAIDPATGVVTVADGSSLSDPSYNITVRGTSADGSASTAVFTIDVGLAGDFDGDGDLDIADVDALSTAVAAQSTNLLYDTNGDGQVNFADLQNWVLNIKRTVMGDANLDFATDGSDFNIWNQNKFNSTTLWSRGNFSGDLFVDGSDFNIWNQNKFHSGPGRPLQRQGSRKPAGGEGFAVRAWQLADDEHTRAADEVFARSMGLLL